MAGPARLATRTQLASKRTPVITVCTYRRCGHSLGFRTRSSTGGVAAHDHEFCRRTRTKCGWLTIGACSAARRVRGPCPALGGRCDGIRDDESVYLAPTPVATVPSNPFGANVTIFDPSMSVALDQRRAQRGAAGNQRRGSSSSCRAPTATRRSPRPRRPRATSFRRRSPAAPGLAASARARVTS